MSLTRRRFLTAGSLVLAGLTASACTPAPRSEPLQTSIALPRTPRLVLRVEALEIREDWQSPRSGANVEYLMPVSPVTALKRWSAERLGVTGERGAIARLIVLDGAVTEKPLSTQSGFSGLFRTEPSERYDGTLDALLEIVDTETHVVAAQASARVTAFRSLSEKASLDDRDGVWMDLVSAMITDFDKAFESAAHTWLERYLVSPGGAGSRR
ncbi:hypothetical protein IHV25_02530 [Phaeovibrio sulfidiphilus]|uniref:Lipoprotein n=1 Tax=Phaeovibrio sulfidiphilus TaxID=1220600 RepID=A0A8J7CBT6_9PROT|nr:hypothetical protein [Phaeovibrio sulfidiphilus]MBE1236528.1 hypothetical protein [Phaeovibrio sulfidiphilus]